MDRIRIVNHLARPCSVPPQSHLLGRSHLSSFYASCCYVRHVDRIRKYLGLRSRLGHYYRTYLSWSLRGPNTLLLVPQKTNIYHWVFPLNRRKLLKTASFNSHMGSYLHRSNFPLWIHTFLWISCIDIKRNTYFQPKKYLLHSLQQLVCSYGSCYWRTLGSLLLPWLMYLSSYQDYYITSGLAC